jgi:hypothetical protein
LIPLRRRQGIGRKGSVPRHSLPELRLSRVLGAHSDYGRRVPCLSMRPPLKKR